MVITALYKVFVQGYHGGTSANESVIQAGGCSKRPVTGTIFEGVNGASAAAALTAVQLLTGTVEQGLSHTWLESNDTSA